MAIPRPAISYLLLLPLLLALTFSLTSAQNLNDPATFATICSNADGEPEGNQCYCPTDQKFFDPLTDSCAAPSYPFVTSCANANGLVRNVDECYCPFTKSNFDPATKECKKTYDLKPAPQDGVSDSICQSYSYKRSNSPYKRSNSPPDTTNELFANAWNYCVSCREQNGILSDSGNREENCFCPTTAQPFDPENEICPKPNVVTNARCERAVKNHLVAPATWYSTCLACETTGGELGTQYSTPCYCKSTDENYDPTTNKCLSDKYQPPTPEENVAKLCQTYQLVYGDIPNSLDFCISCLTGNGAIHTSETNENELSCQCLDDGALIDPYTTQCSEIHREWKLPIEKVNDFFSCFVPSTDLLYDESFGTNYLRPPAGTTLVNICDKANLIRDDDLFKQKLMKTLDSGQFFYLSDLYERKGLTFRILTLPSDENERSQALLDYFEMETTLKRTAWRDNVYEPITLIYFEGGDTPAIISMGRVSELTPFYRDQAQEILDLLDVEALHGGLEQPCLIPSESSDPNAFPPTCRYPEHEKAIFLLSEKILDGIAPILAQTSTGPTSIDATVDFTPEIWMTLPDDKNVDPTPEATITASWDYEFPETIGKSYVEVFDSQHNFVDRFDLCVVNPGIDVLNPEKCAKPPHILNRMLWYPPGVYTVDLYIESLDTTLRKASGKIIGQKLDAGAFEVKNSPPLGFVSFSNFNDQIEVIGTAIDFDYGGVNDQVTEATIKITGIKTPSGILERAGSSIEVKEFTFEKTVNCEYDRTASVITNFVNFLLTANWDAKQRGIRLQSCGFLLPTEVTDGAVYMEASATFTDGDAVSSEYFDLKYDPFNLFKNTINNFEDPFELLDRKVSSRAVTPGVPVKLELTFRDLSKVEHATIRLRKGSLNPADIRRPGRIETTPEVQGVNLGPITTPFPGYAYFYEFDQSIPATIDGNTVTASISTDTLSALDLDYRIDVVLSTRIQVSDGENPGNRKFMLKPFTLQNLARFGVCGESPGLLKTNRICGIDIDPLTSSIEPKIVTPDTEELKLTFSINLVDPLAISQYEWQIIDEKTNNVAARGTLPRPFGADSFISRKSIPLIDIKSNFNDGIYKLIVVNRQENTRQYIGSIFINLNRQSFTNLIRYVDGDKPTAKYTVLFLSESIPKEDCERVFGQCNPFASSTTFENLVRETMNDVLSRSTFSKFKNDVRYGYINFFHSGFCDTNSLNDKYNTCDWKLLNTLKATLPSTDALIVMDKDQSWSEDLGPYQSVVRIANEQRKGITLAHHLGHILFGLSDTSCVSKENNICHGYFNPLSPFPNVWEDQNTCVGIARNLNVPSGRCRRITENNLFAIDTSGSSIHQPIMYDMNWGSIFDPTGGGHRLVDPDGTQFDQAAQNIIATHFRGGTP